MNEDRTHEFKKLINGNLELTLTLSPDEQKFLKSLMHPVTVAYLRLPGIEKDMSRFTMSILYTLANAGVKTPSDVATDVIKGFAKCYHVKAEVMEGLTADVTKAPTVVNAVLKSVFKIS